jgi:two-component system, cell cycle sensor histidine kinase DivJ
LVHPSAQQDVLVASRHGAFIALRLLGGIAALASFPIYLFLRGTPTSVEFVVLLWCAAAILTALFVSRTGRYEGAHVLSSLALTCAVVVVAACTGGIASSAIPWLVLVPLEASLSASRKIIAVASMSALAAAALLGLANALELLPMPVAAPHLGLATFGVLSAVLYAAGLAFGAEIIGRSTSRSLRAEEDRCRLLVRNMTDVIARYGQDGTVQYLSPAAHRLLGCGIADLRGQGLFNRVHVADRPAYLRALGDTAAFGESRSAEFRVRCETGDATAGQFVWIEMRCQPLDEAAAAPRANGRCEVVAVLRDITERKQQENALQQAHAEVEHADAAKSRFLATMSHELRTPLNAIIGFSDILKNESTLPLDVQRRIEYATLINESGHHLLAIINGVLDMSKIETDNFEITPEPFAPAPVMAACCNLLALRAAEAGVRLEQSPVPHLPDVVADRRAVNQILLNLLSNAIRFSDRGGRVTIGARAEAGNLIFVVEDFGIGISEGDLTRLGEPYFQAHSSYDRRHGGTGLGLSIVKGLVRLHGGTIEIHSRVGTGTRVCVHLPLDCERARNGRAAVAESPAVMRLLSGSFAQAREASTAARELVHQRKYQRMKQSA